MKPLNNVGRENVPADFSEIALIWALERVFVTLKSGNSFLPTPKPINTIPNNSIFSYYLLLIKHYKQIAPSRTKTLLNHFISPIVYCSNFSSCVCAINSGHKNRFDSISTPAFEKFLQLYSYTILHIYVHIYTFYIAKIKKEGAGFKRPPP